MPRLLFTIFFVFSLSIHSLSAEPHPLAAVTEVTPMPLSFDPDIQTIPEQRKQKDEPPPDRFFMELVNMAFSLVFIVAVLLLISWLVKRMMGNRMQQMNTKSGIKIIEHRALTSKSVVYVLDIYGKNMAVVESTNGIVSLGMLPSFADETSPTVEYDKGNKQ